MHRYLLAISAGWHGRYIGEFILHAVGILIKGVLKTISISVSRNCIFNGRSGPAAIFVADLFQLDIALDLGTISSNFIYDLRTLQVLSVRILDAHSPCYGVGVGIVRTVFPDTVFKLSCPPLPIIFVVGTRFIFELNVTGTCSSVFDYLNAIGQPITLAGG